ncbi:MAG: HPr family phosphocarrier protein [Lachnospiraceae bacterium]|nr:HPr family phosphocarrier protein [Lachnospiraceae bacterium]
MKSFTYTIQDELGIHARPAGLLAKAVGAHKSTVVIDSGAKKADAKRLMAVMSLGVKKGDIVTVTVEGEDEDVAAAAIEEFFRTNL